MYQNYEHPMTGKTYTLDDLDKAVDELYVDEFMTYIDDTIGSASDLVAEAVKQSCKVEDIINDLKIDFANYIAENYRDFYLIAYDTAD